MSQTQVQRQLTASHNDTLGRVYKALAEGRLAETEEEFDARDHKIGLLLMATQSNIAEIGKLLGIK